MNAVASQIEAPQTKIADNLVRYAGFWWRSLAIIIDSILISIAVLTVALIGYFLWPNLRSLEPGSGLRALMQITIFISFWLYYTLFESSRLQATPGKNLSVESHKFFWKQNLFWPSDWALFRKNDIKQCIADWLLGSCGDEGLYRWFR